MQLKETEKRTTEQAKRKQMIANLPKLFDRIYYLFQSPKSSAITREALIRDLTECHPDITDQSKLVIYEFHKALSNVKKCTDLAVLD